MDVEGRGGFLVVQFRVAPISFETEPRNVSNDDAPRSSTLQRSEGLSAFLLLSEKRFPNNIGALGIRDLQNPNRTA